MLDTIATNLDKKSARPAFFIDTTVHTYGALAERIAAIQPVIDQRLASTNQIVAVVDNADLDTYASMLAVLFSGHAYLPINPRNPSARNVSILQQANAELLLASGEHGAPDLALASPDVQMALTSRLGAASGQVPRLKSVPDTNLAYLLFTSGSTGVPKGVPISRRNLAAFLEALQRIIELREDDRVLQMFDLTFDFSVMSSFAPLMVGACVYPAANNEMRPMSVYRLLEEQGITCAPMVPSVLAFLRPYFDDIRLDKLRLSVFCGEPLLADVTQQWSACGSNMRIVNFYGPTEATVFCSYYEWSPARQKAVNGALSIGRAMAKSRMCVVDERNSILPPFEHGELCIAGEQLTSGYWRNPQKDAEAFFDKEINGTLVRLYRTGDIAYVDDDGDFMYLGRLDQQVKVQGFRIELGEIEHGARECVGLQQVAAVTITNTTGMIEIVLCLQGFKGDTKAVQDALRRKLPPYMIPARVVAFAELPLNNNGKIDRPKLRQLVAAG